MEVFMVLFSGRLKLEPASYGAGFSVRFWFRTINKPHRLKSVLPKPASDSSLPATFPGPQPQVPRSHMSLQRLRDPPRREASCPNRAKFSPALRGTGARFLAG